MPPKVFETILKLALISLVVGVVFMFFDIHPRDLVENFGETIQWMFKTTADLIKWAVEPILLGAVVVLPIWLILFLINKAHGRSGTVRK
ncbi:MAG: DUF6460 domain-containing protein [Magnetovibrio sp.]|nr:DUF6460 domain-containing protein [Magnetovibrio sp.]